VINNPPVQPNCKESTYRAAQEKTAERTPMASASCSLLSSAPSLAFVQIYGNQQAHRGCLKPSTLLPPLPVRFLSAAAVRRCCPASVCRQNVVCAVATEAPPSQRQGSAASPSGVSGEVKELQHSQNNGASKKKNLKVDRWWRHWRACVCACSKKQRV
jgi:hypothetical protein